jgi:hypothetical protein
VLPSHQGRGLGKGIASRLVERSKGHRKIIRMQCRGGSRSIAHWASGACARAWRSSRIRRRPTHAAICASPDGTTLVQSE